MKYIVKNELLEIQYIPGNGAWTYQLIVPNTKDIQGKWGDLKVSGMIDNYAIVTKNLGPVKNSDKKLALNAEIRKSIGKSAGELVKVTLYLEDQNVQKAGENEMVLDCFKDADVLNKFKKLSIGEQDEIIQSINRAATENQKAEKIINYIAKLEKLKLEH